MAKEPVLLVSRLTAGYDQLPIIEDVSLAVAAGEVVAILGPNGAGKSTLLKAAYGLIDRHGGTVQVAGQDVSRLRADEMTGHGMSYVPQVENVFANLTVEENLRMGAFLKPKEFPGRRDEILDLFPALRDPLKRKAGTLSGGQRNMLAMARGMMITPLVLLLDEPTAGLAPMIAGQVWEKTKEIAAAGTAVVIVEQNVVEALTYSDRAYILVAGQNRFDGTVEVCKREDLGAMFLGH